jgi:hypothetical protein
MTQQEIFWALLLTVIMWISGIKELVIGQNQSLGALLMFIPICGWVSLMWGK